MIEPFSGFDKEQGQMQYGVSATATGPPLQQTKTAYTTAVRVQEPRSISRIASNVIHEASLAGASFYYRWPVKDRDSGQTKYVQGPSIDMAMCMIRNYGNCVLDIEVEELPGHYVFKGIVIDLESGFTCPRLFRQRKSQKMGRYDSGRAEDISFQVGQSKALRNAIVHAMPSWLVDQAMTEAQSAELRRIKPENIAAARAQCITYFRGYGITPERIENVIGRKADDWTAEDIANLRANATAIKEGRISAESVFPVVEKEKMGAEPESKPQESSPWDIENWRHMKSPGVQNLALDHKDSFKDQPIEVRKQFEIKWRQCRDVGPWPFDEDGDWIGLGPPAKHKQDFDSWAKETFIGIDIEKFAKYLDTLSTLEGIDPATYKEDMMQDFDVAVKILDGFNTWLKDLTIGAPAIREEEENGESG